MERGRDCHSFRAGTHNFSENSKMIAYAETGHILLRWSAKLLSCTHLTEWNLACCISFSELFEEVCYLWIRMLYLICFEQGLFSANGLSLWLYSLNPVEMDGLSMLGDSNATDLTEAYSCQEFSSFTFNLSNWVRLLKECFVLRSFICPFPIHLHNMIYLFLNAQNNIL